MSDEFGSDLVTIEDEETGEEIELEFVDALEYQGVVYRAFFPVVEEGAGEEEEEKYDLIIMKAEDIDSEYLIRIDRIEDEEEFNAVYDLFMEQILEDEEG